MRSGLSGPVSFENFHFFQFLTKIVQNWPVKKSQKMKIVKIDYITKMTLSGIISTKTSESPGVNFGPETR